MPASQMDRPLLATLAFCVLALGAWTLSQEAAQYVAVGTRIQRVAAMPEHPPFPGLAMSTRQDNLRDCIFALRRQASLEVRYISEEFRAGLPARCAAMALEAVELMPTYSYGWFALAYTDALAGNWDAMNEHLYRSQVTGQASQWVAEQRVAVAESYREHLDARSRGSNDADLQMLVLSQRGIRSIAARYSPRIGRGSLADVQQVAKQSSRIGLVGLPLSALGVLLAPTAIDFLFGHEFEAAVQGAQILIATYGVLSVFGAYGQVVLLRGGERIAIFSVVASLVVTVGLTLVLTPFISITGYSIAYAAGMATSYIIAALIGPRVVAVRPGPF